MNNLRNKVQLIGHLGADPEIINLDSGKKLVKFSIATNESYRDSKGKRVEQTQWHHVVAWNKTAELAQKYLITGSEVAIQGKLVNRNFETPDGQKRYVSEIIINEILLLGSKSR